jgi:hypothetical protein
MNNPSQKKQSFRFRRSLMKRVFVRSLTLLLLVSTLFLAACKDKNTPSLCESSPGSCQSVLEAKDLFLFNVGTWWVYEEETSHIRDSIYVTQSYNSNDYNFDIRLYSDLTGYTSHYWSVYYGTGNSECSLSGLSTSKCLHVKYSKWKFQDFLGESDAFFISYKIGDFIYNGGNMTSCPDNKIKITAIFENYSLPTLNFEKTVQVDENCCSQEEWQPTRIFYSKKVGIIRKELLDSNQVWNLVAYHIEQ